LTCGPWKRDHRWETGALARSLSDRPRRRQRARPARREAAEKAATLSPRHAKAPARQPLDPKPVTCRQARSRWRPDDRKVVRRLPRTKAATPRSRRISKQNVGGFSHGARRAVSEEGVFAAGARERNVGCRSGFEAPRQCAQGKPQGPHEEHIAKRQEGKRPGTGPAVILFAKGCNGSRRPKGGVSPRLRRPSNRWPLDRASASGPPAAD
jgi:hypothetical protein